MLEAMESVVVFGSELLLGDQIPLIPHRDPLVMTHFYGILLLLTSI
jgi:hypothetical protein